MIDDVGPEVGFNCSTEGRLQAWEVLKTSLEEAMGTFKEKTSLPELTQVQLLFCTVRGL